MLSCPVEKQMGLVRTDIYKTQQESAVIFKNFSFLLKKTYYFDPHPNKKDLLTLLIHQVQKQWGWFQALQRILSQADQNFLPS